MKYYGKITDDKDLVTKEYVEANGGKIEDVQVNGTSVVTDKVANINNVVTADDSTELGNPAAINADTLEGNPASYFQTKLTVNPETTSTTLSGLTIDGTSYSLGGGNVDDVKVDGVSVVNNKIASIDLSGKQDKLTAGSGITISNGVISSSITYEEA